MPITLTRVSEGEHLLRMLSYDASANEQHDSEEGEHQQENLEKQCPFDMQKGG